MDKINPNFEIVNKAEQGSSREIDEFINEGISSILLSKQEYSVENLKTYEDNVDISLPGSRKYSTSSPDDSYLNCILKSEETTKSAQTQLDEPSDIKHGMDSFYMGSFGPNEIGQNDPNYMKNLENQLFFFGNNVENVESSLSYQFGLMDNMRHNMGTGSGGTNYDFNSSNATNSPYTITNDYSEDKSEKNSRDFSKDLTYGEHIIYNKIDTLQRMIKNMIMTMHEKYNNDSNLRYEAFMNESVNDSSYDFTLAQMFSQKNQKRASLKLLASHGVIGSFFGSSGHRVQALQQEFNVNVSVTTKRIHFPGSNNKGVLLISGKLYNVLKVLRPLYRAIQEEVIRLLIDESVRIEPAQIRLEIEVLIPESLRFTMDRNKYFKQIMEMTGANIRVIKQTYEDGPVQERVLVLFGTQTEIELALEKIALMIQEDAGFKHYAYMNYPDLTIALNANDYTLRYSQRKNDIENKLKKKY